MTRSKLQQENCGLTLLIYSLQLHLQMVAGHTFPFYSESRITFFPTYKYDNGTDNYDTSYVDRRSYSAGDAVNRFLAEKNPGYQLGVIASYEKERY